MVKTIKKRQGILGVLKVPGTPKSEKRQHFSILGEMSGKHDFSTLERKNAKIWFSAFWGAGDLQNTKHSLSFLDGFDHGCENDPFYCNGGNLIKFN